MSLIVGLTVPTTALDIGSTLTDCAFSRIDLDRIVPHDGSFVRYLWVYDADPASFCDRLEAHAHVDSVDLLDVFADAFLCRVSAHMDTDGLYALLRAQDAVVLEASGTSQRWDVRLRFHTAEGASRFHAACHEQDVPITITEVHDLAGPADDSLDGTDLTAAQRETLQLALERGYYTIPRRTTIVELAAMLEISDQALSERFRRAHLKLARAAANGRAGHAEAVCNS